MMSISMKNFTNHERARNQWTDRPEWNRKSLVKIHHSVNGRKIGCCPKHYHALRVCKPDFFRNGRKTLKNSKGAFLNIYFQSLKIISIRVGDNWKRKSLHYSSQSMRAVRGSTDRNNLLELSILDTDADYRYRWLNVKPLNFFSGWLGISDNLLPLLTISKLYMNH